MNKRQQDNINGLWLLLLAQLIHQKCGEESSLKQMERAKQMRWGKGRLDGSEFNKVFIYALCWRFMMWLLWVRDHKTLLGWLFGKQFNELLRLFTTINRLWSRQYSTMIVCSTLQHQNNKTAKRSVEKSSFSLPCRQRTWIITVVRLRRNCAVWLVRVSVLFANGWCGSVRVLATTRKQ